MLGSDKTGHRGLDPIIDEGFGFRGGQGFSGRGMGLAVGCGNRGFRQRKRLCRRSMNSRAETRFPGEMNFPGGSEMEVLRQEAQQMETSLDRIKKRLSELEKQEEVKGQ